MQRDGKEQSGTGGYDRRSLLRALGAGGVVGLAGCSGDGDGDGGGNGDGDGNGDGNGGVSDDGDGGDDAVKVGGILPLTGGLADPAQWIERAWNIRTEQVNENGGLLGREIDLTIYDTELDEQQMQTTASRLISQDDVDIFLGPYPTITAPVISPILSREDMTALHMFWPKSQIDEYADGEGQWPNQYGFSAGTLDYPWVFIQYLDSLEGDVRPERIAMIGRNDIYGEDAAAAFEQFVGEIDDMEIVVDERFEVGTTDLAPVVRNVEGTDADVIVCNSYGNGSQLFAQAVAEVGLDPDFLWANVGPQVPAWFSLESTGEHVFGSSPYAYSVPTEANEELFEVAQNEYGELPHYSFGFGTIQFDIYQQAIEEIGEIDQQAMADTFDSMTFESVTGEVSFENNYVGYNNTAMYLTQARGEELPIVWPPDSQTADPIAPLPDEWPDQEWP